jgi:hypothetical protein
MAFKMEVYFMSGRSIQCISILDPVCVMNLRERVKNYLGMQFARHINIVFFALEGTMPLQALTPLQSMCGQEEVLRIKALVTHTGLVLRELPVPEVMHICVQSLSGTTLLEWPGCQTMTVADVAVHIQLSRGFPTRRQTLMVPNASLPLELTTRMGEILTQTNNSVTLALVVCSRTCGFCGSCSFFMPKCSGCGGVHYCSTACRDADWPSHRDACRLAQQTDGVIRTILA